MCHVVPDGRPGVHEDGLQSTRTRHHLIAPTRGAKEAEERWVADVEVGMGGRCMTREASGGSSARGSEVQAASAVICRQRVREYPRSGPQMAQGDHSGGTCTVSDRIPHLVRGQVT